MLYSCVTYGRDTSFIELPLVDTRKSAVQLTLAQ